MRNVEISLNLTGDYFLGVGYDHSEALAIKAFLEKESCSIVNFEGAFSANTEVREKAVNLEMEVDSLQYLPNTILSLANNHVLDFGYAGLKKTLDSIADEDFLWFGLESKRWESDNYLIFEHQGLRICLLGFGWRNEECVEATENTPGVVNFTQSNIDRSIERLKTEQYDYLLAYVHYGYEHEYYPLPLHVGLSRYLIDQGVDFVYGSHTHCVQPYEIYREKYIFYGLGNFFFSPGRERYPVESDRGLLVNISFSKIKHQVVIESVRKIQFFSKKTGFEIMDDTFLEEDRLVVNELSEYSRSYKKIRRRNKNPRPIMFYQQDFMNALKYRLWLFVVQLTGYLGVRKLVKKVLGWA